MKKSMTVQRQPEETVLGFGKVLGQSVAFGTVAGRCSAAQAAALREARNERIYKRLGLTWKEFCPRHLRMSGTQADEIIRLLEEFGPEYFEHTETVRISAGTYRLVAPLIRDKALRVEGEVLELNSANVQRVAKSLRESRRALPAPAPEPEPVPEPEPEAPAEVPILSDRLNALHRRAVGVIAEFREIARDSREAEPSLIFHSMLRGTLTFVTNELYRVSAENGAL